MGDLGHLLEASGCGARVTRSALPVNPWIGEQGAYDQALFAGDDYEICCTMPAKFAAEIDTWNRQNPDCRLTPIGEITEAGYRLYDGEQWIDLSERQGYRHFD